MVFDWLWYKGLLKIPIKSFLTSKSTKVNNQSSKIHSVNTGDLLGSILGPNLFLIFINDLCDHTLLSFINIFADDTTLYHITLRNFE